MTDDARLIAALRAGVPRIDTNVANAARVWNYIAGDKDNFEADRVAARRMMAAAPVVRVIASATRAFIRRGVRYLAGEAGIRQFLEVGTRMPSATSTHEVAQSVAPECRVVYVDDDPVVLAHDRAMLTSAPEGVVAYVDTDARHPGRIITEAGATLDFAEPVAILMVGSLHFIEDDQVAASGMAALTGAVAPGSYLAVIHGASDVDPGLREAEWHWNQMCAQRLRLRTRDQVARFLAGLELVEPGLVTVAEWRPDAGEPAPGQQIPMYAAVARKP
jgi:S-adenosyl methyltransferase